MPRSWYRGFSFALSAAPTTVEPDGWWWGSDDNPLQVGPFASSEEALADARRGAERFKLVRWNEAELRRPDRPLPPRGHIIVIDTSGKLWARTGERFARADWKPKQ
jgi:hypothetical protein